MNIDLLAPWPLPQEQRHYFAYCSRCEWEEDEWHSTQCECANECEQCLGETEIEMEWN